MLCRDRALQRLLQSWAAEAEKEANASDGSAAPPDLFISDLDVAKDELIIAARVAGVEVSVMRCSPLWVPRAWFPPCGVSGIMTMRRVSAGLWTYPNRAPRRKIEHHGLSLVSRNATWRDSSTSPSLSPRFEA